MQVPIQVDALMNIFIILIRCIIFCFYLSNSSRILFSGCSITLESAIKSLLPEIFEDKLSIHDDLPVQGDSEAGSGLGDEEITGIMKNAGIDEAYKEDRIKLIRIQGIKLDAHIPFCWVVNNLRNPEYYLHICVFVGSFLLRAR